MKIGEYYFNGDACNYTGNTKMCAGKICYETVCIEGVHTGETRWTYKPKKEVTV